MNLLIPSLTLLPLLAAVIISLIPKENKREVRLVSLSAATAVLLISGFLVFRYDVVLGGYQFTFRKPWISSLGVSYHTGIDGIGSIMILLHALCSFSAVLVSFKIKERVKEYFVFLMILIASIFGVFTALDLFFLYVFYEMAVIPLYPLVATWGSKNKEYGAMKLTLYITAGAVLALVGLLALYQMAGIRSFDLIEIQNHLRAQPLSRSFQMWCAPLLIFGFGVIASLWPFHSWSPIGYAAAPSAVSMLHAGVLKKIGIYAIIRIVLPLLPYGAEKWFPLISILAVVNILYGAWAAMTQNDLKFVIGFASVSHMGYALLGISAFNEMALSGVVFFMFAHGIMAALCFALIGYIDHEAHTREISELGGLAKQIPFISVCFVAASLASSGLPGFGNFVSEIIIFFGSYQTRKVETILAIFGIVITATFMLRVVRNVFFGKLKSSFSEMKDAKTFSERLPYGLLVLVLLIVGFWPAILLDIIRPSIAPIFFR